MNKILDTLVTDGTLETIAKELGLQCTPYITYDLADNTGYIMAAVGAVYKTFLTITKSETDGEIKVNAAALERKQKEVLFMCGGNKKAAYDLTLILLRHECRHLWQYENGFFTGMSTIKVSFGGHGEEPEEVDANEWALSMCENERIRALAAMLVHQQNQDSLFNGAGYYRDSRKKIIYAVKQYSIPMYLLLNIIAKFI